MVKQLLKKLARRVFGRGAASDKKQRDSSHASAVPARAAGTKPEKRAEHAVPAAKPAREPHAAPPRDSRPKSRPQGPRSEHAPGASRHARPVEPPAAPWSPDSFVVAPKEGASRFHDFDLPAEIMHAVQDAGFQYCTGIQAKVLGPALQGHHIMGQAQTGTGKTAAFLISVFAQFLKRPAVGERRAGVVRALILAPTRELVIQIAHDAAAMGKYCPFRCVAVYGGMDFDRQARAMQESGADIIAATPGRLMDFLRRGIVDLHLAEALVIDEADRMLDMGFIPDVRSIIRRMPPAKERQTLLFSATLSEDVRRLASQWMVDPVLAEVAPEQVAVDTVMQLVYVVSSREKFTVLYNLLRQPACKRVLIFGNRRDSTLRLADHLLRYGIPCGLLSGAIDQKKRLRILEDFKEGRVSVLVATDVAGRGLHVDSITHVINFDFPYEADDYVHRIGRTGRAGAEGTAISFACEDESFIIPEIEKYIGEPLVCRQPEAPLLVPLPPPIRGETHHFADDAAEHEAHEQRRQGGGGGRGGPRRGPPRRGGGGPRRSGGSRPRR